MSERAPTFAQLRAEARRVFGDDLRKVDQWSSTMKPCVSVFAGERELMFQHVTFAAARRFALETLRQLPSAQKDGV